MKLLQKVKNGEHAGQRVAIKPLACLSRVILFSALAVTTCHVLALSEAPREAVETGLPGHPCGPLRPPQAGTAQGRGRR